VGVLAFVYASLAQLVLDGCLEFAHIGDCRYLHCTEIQTNGLSKNYNKVTEWVTPLQDVPVIVFTKVTTVHLDHLTWKWISLWFNLLKYCICRFKENWKTKSEWTQCWFKCKGRRSQSSVWQDNSYGWHFSKILVDGRPGDLSPQIMGFTVLWQNNQIVGEPYMDMYRVVFVMKDEV